MSIKKKVAFETKYFDLDWSLGSKIVNKITYTLAKFSLFLI